MVGSKYHYLTLKTGLFSMFFIKKQNRSINTGSRKSKTNNIIPLCVSSISESRCLTRKFATRWRVTSVQSLSSPPQIVILISVPKGIQNLLTIPNSRLLLSLRPFLLLRALLAGPDQSSALISRPFRIERKLALTCLNTQTTLPYKHQKRATILIVTILFGINSCSTKLSNINKREGRITSRLGGCFLLLLYIFCFLFFFVIFYVFGFFLGTILLFVCFCVYL